VEERKEKLAQKNPKFKKQIKNCLETTTRKNTHTHPHTKRSQTTRSKKKVRVLSIGTNEEHAIIVGVCVTQVCWRFVWPKIGNCGLVAGF
jgi:acetate kinase